MSALLRTCTKYKLHRPKGAILDFLRSELPCTLVNYDANIAKGVNPRADGAAAITENTGVHPAKMISLLRECDYSSPDLLVPLFYSLTTYIPQFTAPPDGRTIAALSMADTERFIIGLNKLRCFNAASGQCPVYTVVHPPPDSDSRQSVLCQYELLRFWHNVVGPRLFDVKDQMCHPIDDWGKLSQMARDGNMSMAGSLCSDCKGKVMLHIVHTRQKIWDTLPELFGFS